MNNNLILIGHGSGGRLTQQLIKDVFHSEFGNELLDKNTDAAVISDLTGQLAFTTDSFVIDPVFFPGGDIGKLAVCGTINDLCVIGAIPRYLSIGFIIEEGLPIAELKTIARSIAIEAKKNKVLIATGDTKVVKRGQCDKIYINTSGIGVIPEQNKHLSDITNIKPGDLIIVTGTLGDHAIAVLSAREDLKLTTSIQSDATSLFPLTEMVLRKPEDILFMRDITRGGLATILNEISQKKSFGIEIDEADIPVHKTVKSVCELYGFDPIYLANEGKLVMIIKASAADSIIKLLHSIELGKDAAIIGRITNEHPSKVVMNSNIGGKRIVDMLSGEMLPRIC